MKEEITAFLRAKTKNLFHDYFEGAKEVLLEDNNFSLLGDFLCLSVSCFLSSATAGAKQLEKCMSWQVT